MQLPQLTVQQRAKLREFLTCRFNMGELQTITFDLGIDYETLRHDTKINLVVSLIESCQKQGLEMLVDLIEQAVATRKDEKIIQILSYLKSENDYQNSQSKSFTDLHSKEKENLQIVESRLRTLIQKTHNSFRQSRLETFVGRAKELEEIEAKIAAKLPTGGYITITGQAGQGKSSIIAQLIEMHGAEQVAYHFIPFNPGPDYQVSLLRDIMARLIVKHNLSDIYVASESRQALRDFFFYILKEIADKGKQEIIFIDGLDQIEHDQSGVRDLSFLPEQSPIGILFVLGTRPDDTLAPLELRNHCQEYKLPNLSREDFDLILQQRQVHLGPILVDHFYEAMQQNALYLDLVAKELAHTNQVNAEELITTLSHNPDNIFTYSINRLKKLKFEWQAVIKPILGLLLVAQEPLRKISLQKIIDVDEEKVREGLQRLAGLLAEDGEGRYYLYHLKLKDYLRQNINDKRKDYVFDAEAEKLLHKKMIEWCEQGGLELIWQNKKREVAEQDRREYARKHYITHLYQSGDYEKLWGVLDAGEYGKAKLRYEPSTRAYAQDLDLGRKAASQEDVDFEEGITLLPKLCRYSLLRNSLASRANSYPVKIFEVLILLGRREEALGLIELLTQLEKKIIVLTSVSKLLKQHQEENDLADLLLKHAFELAKKVDGEQKRRVIKNLMEVADLGNDAYLSQLLVLIDSVKESYCKNQLLQDLVIILAQKGQIEKAFAVVQSISENYYKTSSLCEIAIIHVLAGEIKKAEELIRSINNPYQEARVLSKLASAYIKLKQKKAAQITLPKVCNFANSAKSVTVKADILREIGSVQAQLGEMKEAQKSLVGALELVINDFEHQDINEALEKIARTCIELGQFEAAFSTVRFIKEPDHNDTKDRILSEIAKAQLLNEQVEATFSTIKFIESSIGQARILVEVAEVRAQKGQVDAALIIARSISEDREKARALSKIAEIQTQIGQIDAGLSTFTEAIHSIEASTNTNSEAVQALCEIAETQIKVGQVTEAEKILKKITGLPILIEHNFESAKALSRLAEIEIETKQLELASTIAYSIKSDYLAAHTLNLIAQSQAQLGLIKLALNTFKDATEIAALLVPYYPISQKKELLTQLAVDQAQLRLFNIAINTSNLISEDYDKDKVLTKIAQLQTQANKIEEALAMGGLIKFENNKIEVLTDVALTYYHTGQLKEAEAILDQSIQMVSSIDGVFDKALALTKIASTQAAIGQTIIAKSTFKDASERADAITATEAKLRILAQIAEAQEQTNLTEELSITLKKFIDNTVTSNISVGQVDRLLSDALVKVIKLLIRFGRKEDSLQIAFSIGDILTIDNLLSELAEYQAELGQFEEALATANLAEENVGSIEELVDYHPKDYVLSKIARNQARMGNVEEAIHLLESIEAKDARISALNEIATAQAIFGSIEAAKSTLEEATKLAILIQEDARYSYSKEPSPLYRTILNKIKVGLLEDALNSTKDIWKKSEKATLLEEIVNEFTKQGKMERVLEIVQNEWLQADTLDYALKLLPLSKSLILLKPELGKEFFEDFGWVDGFLGNF